MPSILFADLHRPGRSPSQRFRYEQFLPHLAAAGFSWQHSYLIDASADKVYYSPGKYGQKAGILLKSLWKRLGDIRRAHQFDIVFVQREAFMLGTAFFEQAFGKRSQLVFDLDDAIWLPPSSEGNKDSLMAEASPNQRLSFLKNPEKTNQIISLAQLVLAGNSYLQTHAQRFNPNSRLIPTCIDTLHHRPMRLAANKKFTIGWTGSHTTVPYFLDMLPVWQRLQAKYGNSICFKVHGSAQPLEAPGIDLETIPWSVANEVSTLNSFDVGVMPLPNNAWTKGKCGFKGLQYMACEIPAVLANVGVNAEIVQHGHNGLLANSASDWETCLSQLIENPALCKKLGQAGRQTIQERYSVEKWGPILTEWLQGLCM